MGNELNYESNKIPKQFSQSYTVFTGTVTYTAIANVDIPWAFDSSAKEVFYVCEILDLVRTNAFNI